MAIQLVTMTPTWAKEILKHAAPNRSIRKRRVQLYGDAMRGNAWKLTGEPIIIDGMGRLLDGQHRLEACILSNTSFRTYLVEGEVDEDAMVAIDSGLSRGPGDALYFLGEQNVTIMAATVHWLYRYQTDQIRMERTFQTRPELIEFVEKHREALQRAIPYGKKLRKYMLPSMGAALYFLAERDDPELAPRVFNKLIVGGDYTHPTAILLLREVLSNNKAYRKRLPVSDIWALTVKAWNYERRGFVPRRMTWWPNQTRPESFPTFETPL